MGNLNYSFASVICVLGPYWCSACLSFISMSVVSFLSFQQHHASILFCVHKEFGAFLYFLLCTMLRSCGALLSLCLHYVCSDRELMWLLLIWFHYYKFVIHLILGTHLMLSVRFLPPAHQHIPCLDWVSQLPEWLVFTLKFETRNSWIQIRSDNCFFMTFAFKYSSHKEVLLLTSRRSCSMELVSFLQVVTYA
jgi:hypothetical protein